MSCPVGLYLLGLLLVGASHAFIGETEVCCELAAREIKSIKNLTINPNLTYVCGQTYSQGLPAARDLKVPYAWCVQNCSGWKLYNHSDTDDWALPLVSFIFAAVIFSTAIPRKRVLKLPRKRSWQFNLLSFFLSPFAIIFDTVFLVFAIMVTAGPSMLSGLIELSLDYKVTRRATNTKSKNHCLTPEQHVELLTAVLAGNLLHDGAADPQTELGLKLPPHPVTDSTKNGLLSMLECQASFGGAVGAAVLLYIGQFVYTLSSLGGTTSDKATARALAFGIWWMTIVHVSVIGASLLASNNPSTAAAIAQKLPDHKGHEWKRATLAYETRFKPAWMWFRGTSKIRWLHNTSAWRDTQEFREYIQMSGWLWTLLIFVTMVLFFLPCALAFWIEYRTPPVTVGCRSMTILLYIVAQMVLLAFSVRSHIKAFDEDPLDNGQAERGEQHHPGNQNRRREWRCPTLGELILYFFLFVAVFVTFVGTLMQITGIFQNCWCGADYSFSYKRPAFVSLAGDTAADRDSSKYWTDAGATALTFLGVVTYGGWFCQRSLRNTFIERVENLPTNTNGVQDATLPEPGAGQGTNANNADNGAEGVNANEHMNEAQPAPPNNNQNGGLQPSPPTGGDDGEQITPLVGPLRRASTFVIPFPSARQQDNDEYEMNHFQQGR